MYDIFFQYQVSSTVMDFVAVVFMLALLSFFSFDATVFSVNKDLYIVGPKASLLPH